MSTERTLNESEDSMPKVDSSDVNLDEGAIEHQVQIWSMIQVCTKELKRELEKDLEGIKHYANYLQPNPRSAFLYSVVGEIEKTLNSEILHLTMESQIRWKDYDEETANTLQQVLEDFLKPQIRKMKEFYARLCLFAGTNDDKYYRHYMLLDYLNKLQYVVKDYKDYYEIRSNNHTHTISLLKGMAGTLEHQLDKEKLWYTKVYDIASWSEGRKLLVSEAQIIREAISVMSPDDRVIFGTTYAEAYSSISESLHSSAMNQSYSMAKQYLVSIRSLAEMLCVCTIRRIYELLGRPKLMNTMAICEVQESEIFSEPFYRKYVARDIPLKEFVVVQGLLGQVIDKKVSKYGYVSYSVQFLLESPVSGMDTDWYPSYMLRCINKLQRQSLHAIVRKIVSEHSIDIPDEIIESSLTSSVKELWTKYLREYLILNGQI